MTTTAAVAPSRSLRERAAEVRALARADLLALQADAVAQRREADLVAATVAAEIARRSSADDGQAGFARREGYATPQKLVAAATGGSEAEAGRLIAVGEVLDGAATPVLDVDAKPESGEAPSPAPRYPALADAVKAGELSVEAAAVIRTTLDDLRCNDVPIDRVAEAERRLVDKAPGLPLTKVRRMCRWVEADLAPETLAKRERVQHLDRALVVHEEPSGMVKITALLDPVSAAPVRAFVDGFVKHQFQSRRDEKQANPDEFPTAPQLRADALVWLARHATGCDAGHGGVKTTIVVRVDEEALQTGAGVAEVDGGGPISVEALRQLAADAEVIPAVLSGRSQVLDWGRRRRLFTADQRLALVERDGGCARCHAPPDWCEVHHIRWWRRDRGPTDLANGVLLCVRCHKDIHRDGWGIEVIDGEVWFTPPGSVDRARTPRLGGRARLDARVRE